MNVGMQSRLQRVMQTRLLESSPSGHMLLAAWAAAYCSAT